MIKLFVTDLDGTLLNDQKKVNENDRMALQKLQRLGVRCCLASGRLRFEMLRVAEYVGGRFDLICQNGAHVETAEGHILAQSRFEANLARALYSALDASDALLVACLPEEDLIKERTPRALAVEQRLFTAYKTVPDLKERIGHDLLPSKFSIFGDLSVLKELQQQLSGQFSQRITTYVSAIDCLDVMPAEVSKGSALEVLMRTLQLNEDEVACVGDSYNDVSMFSVAKHSFAMHHGDQGVREQARHVTYSIADAVEHITLR